MIFLSLVAQSNATMGAKGGKDGGVISQVVNRGFVKPSPNAVIAEGFFANSGATSPFNILVNQITTGYVIACMTMLLLWF